MSNYKLGLRTSVGADLPLVTAFENRAKVAEKIAPAQFNVITIDRDGVSLRTFGFPTRDAASGKYDEVASAPGEVAYVAVFDRTQPNQPYDSAYFVAATSVNTHTRTQSIAGWVAGGLAAIGGLMLATRKGRH